VRVRFAAHYGLNSDIELGPKSAIRRHGGAYSRYSYIQADISQWG